MTSDSSPITIITGASSGIGAATARFLSQRGHRLWLLARRESRLQDLCAEFRSAGGQADYQLVDVRERRQVEAAVQHIVTTDGRIDNLVNNAGYSIFKKLNETTVEEIEDILQTNFLGSVYCTKAVLPHMIEAGRGSIVAVSSVVGKIGFPNYGAYAGSKFAMSGFFEALHHDVKALGVHVGIVYPSGTDTEFFKHPSYQQRATVRFYSIQSPETVARAIFKALNGKMEVTRPRFYGVMVQILNALKPLTHSMIGRLNPSKKNV
jgi:hypothetical protein